MNFSYQKFKKKVYRDLAKSYQEREQGEEEDLEEKIDCLLDGLSPGQKFLDLGCGTGSLLVRASSIVAETGFCWGLDLSWEMLAIAKNRLEEKENIRLQQVDVTLGLPFEDNSFDLVVAANLMQEIPSVSFLAEEIYRIVKPGGIFRFLIPYLVEENQAGRSFAFIGRKYYWYFHTQKELEQILENSDSLAKKLKLEFRTKARKGFSKMHNKHKEFSSILQEMAELGYAPQDVQKGVLLVEGKK